MTGKISYIYEDGSPQYVKFHCDDCGAITEGFSLCLKCNPQTYEVIKTYDAEPKQFKAIWNEAIEAAAKLAETSKGYPTTVSENILRLKK
jgi:hypothetical protein